MKNDNVFLHEPDDYVRTLDVVGEAKKQAAKYLSLKSGKPLEECLEYMERVTAPGGKFELSPVKINILKRKENGDRVKVETDIDKYINSVVKTKSILSPNGIVYDNIETRLSPNSVFTQDCKDRRSVIKTERDKTNDVNVIESLTNEEKGIKRVINAASGAAASNHNIFFAPSSHSSMTSGTRVATGYSNGSTESMICGLRHYWEFTVVINSILSTVANIDVEKVKQVCEEYKLHYPTAEETLALIKHSTKHYFNNPLWDYEIKLVVTGLNDVERAAFCYMGDLYHFFKYHPDLVVSILREYVVIPRHDISEDDVKKANKLDKELHIRAKAILCDEIGDADVYDLVETNKQVFNAYINVVLNIPKVNLKWERLLSCFLGADILPIDVFNHYQAIRQAIPGGDTDSTMYTVQNWRTLLKPFMDMEEYHKVKAILFYFNDQLVAHKLAMFCTAMGVHKTQIFDLKMKNEYSMPTYMRTPKTKHYAVKVNMREGKLISPSKLDIRGVWLIDSKKPPEVIKMVHDEISFILDTVGADNKISIMEFSHRVANLEHIITNSIVNGEKDYLFVDQIKTKESYSNPRGSKWMYHDLWEKVFAEEYGSGGVLPYSTVKVSLDLNKKTQLINWANTLTPSQQANFNAWLQNIENIVEDGEDVEDETEDEETVAVSKDKMSMMLIPSDVCDTIPKELLQVLDVRKMVAKMVAPFYILFESLGYQYVNKHYNRLVSDSLPYDEHVGLPGSCKFIKK